MVSPIKRPAASARATARFVARAYLASPSCQSAGSKRSARMAGGSSTPSGCAEGSPLSWLRLCSSMRAAPNWFAACGQGAKSVPWRLLHPCRRQRELPLDLAAVEAVVELHVVTAANSQVSGNVVIEMTARKVHAAHVRTVRENVGEARA